MNYLGMEYIKDEMTYSHLNENNFITEFNAETDKYLSKYEDRQNLEMIYKKYKDCFMDNSEKFINNLRINLHFFKSLDEIGFKKEVERVSLKYHFKQIDDMSSYKNCLYMAVLDEYKQIYVGKCVNGLKNRMRKHWNAKIIPNRQIWSGGFEYSRIKYDNFKLFDTTRLYVCNDIESIIIENQNEANDMRLEHDNTFGYNYYECMSDLDKAERIVINNMKCAFSLSDRVALTTYDYYEELSKKYELSKENLLIKHYIKLDEYKPIERNKEVLESIQREMERKKRKD